VAIAQHGIESIGDGDDACPERNLFTAQAPWIARTIEEFMVGEDDIGGCTRERNALLCTNVKRARFDGAMRRPNDHDSRGVRWCEAGVVKVLLLFFFLATGIPAGFQLRHYPEKRSATTVHTLRNIYVLTPNQTLRIVYTNAWSGNVCMEYVVDDARQQSLIRYAAFEKNSKFVNYDLGQEDTEDRCSMAGTDLTNVAEKELKGESWR
jgi:hypothetical protein